MELQSPASIGIDSELAALLSDLGEEQQRVREMGEFPSSVREELRAAFLPERIADTLTIEGINVNPRVTRSVLEGLALSDTDRYAERGVVNIIEANDFIESLAEKAEPLSSAAVREVHRLTMQGLLQKPGAFRQEDVSITGATFTPPPWGDVPGLVAEIADGFETLLREFPEQHPVIGACWLHVSLAAVHPFPDGNGRVARLVQDHALIRGGLLPVGIPAGRRQEYYEALVAADGDDWHALIAIVTNSEITAFERTRRIAEAPARRRERIRSLVQQSKAVRKRSAHYQYEVWRRQTDAVREEFERWTATLNEEDENVAVGVKVWDPVSFDTWEEIRQRGRAIGTWLFTLNFAVERRRLLSCLFYAKRHRFEDTLDYDPRALTKAVGLFLTAAPSGVGEFNFQRFSDPYIKLRELAYADDGRLFAYRDRRAAHRGEDLPEGVEAELARDDCWESQEDPDLGSLVEELITDAFLKLGLTS